MKKEEGTKLNGVGVCEGGGNCDSRLQYSVTFIQSELDPVSNQYRPQNKARMYIFFFCITVHGQRFIECSRCSVNPSYS